MSVPTKAQYPGCKVESTAVLFDTDTAGDGVATAGEHLGGLGGSADGTVGSVEGANCAGRFALGLRDR